MAENGKENVVAQGKIEGELQESAGKIEYDASKITESGIVAVNSGAADKCADCKTKFSYPGAGSDVPKEKRPCYSMGSEGCANYLSITESSKYGDSE